MPPLSFSAVEILPALLDKSKTQTIRPLNCYCGACGKTHPPEKYRLPCADDNKHCGWSIDYKPPRLKVGQRVSLYWKQRTSPKGSVFCRDCGDRTTKKYYEPSTDDVCMCGWVGKAFPKLLGEVKITEVFEIAMRKDKKYNHMKIFDAYEEGCGNIEVNIGHEITQYIAKRDGFKSNENGTSAINLFKWFDKQYDLSSPKRFAVYRWKWC